MAVFGTTFDDGSNDFDGIVEEELVGLKLMVLV